jgi:hypothetical protein
VPGVVREACGERVLLRERVEDGTMERDSAESWVVVRDVKVASSELESARWWVDGPPSTDAVAVATECASSVLAEPSSGSALSFSFFP